MLTYIIIYIIVGIIAGIIDDIHKQFKSWSYILMIIGALVSFATSGPFVIAAIIEMAIGYLIGITIRYSIRSIIKLLLTILFVWFGVLVLNQVIIKECFSSNCIQEALPVTGIISGFIVCFIYILFDKEEEVIDKNKVKVTYSSKTKITSEASLSPLIKEAREKKQQHLDLLEQLKNG